MNRSCDFDEAKTDSGHSSWVATLRAWLNQKVPPRQQSILDHICMVHSPVDCALHDQEQQREQAERWTNSRENKSGRRGRSIMRADGLVSGRCTQLTKCAEFQRMIVRTRKHQQPASQASAFRTCFGIARAPGSCQWMSWIELLHPCLCHLISDT